MTVSVGRIVLVEFRDVFSGAKPGIVTQVRSYNSVDVTVFGVGDRRGEGTREYREVKFFETVEDAYSASESAGAIAYYPTRVAQDPPKPERENFIGGPDKPVGLSGGVVQRILDIAEKNRNE